MQLHMYFQLLYIAMRSRIYIYAKKSTSDFLFAGSILSHFLKLMTSAISRALAMAMARSL